MKHFSLLALLTLSSGLLQAQDTQYLFTSGAITLGTSFYICKKLTDSAAKARKDAGETHISPYSSYWHKVMNQKISQDERTSAHIHMNLHKAKVALTPVALFGIGSLYFGFKNYFKF